MEFFKAKQLSILEWPSQSRDLNPIEHAFHRLKRKLQSTHTRNKNELKMAAIQAWQSIAWRHPATGDEHESLTLTMQQNTKPDYFHLHNIGMSQTFQVMYKHCCNFYMVKPKSDNVHFNHIFFVTSVLIHQLISLWITSPMIKWINTNVNNIFVLSQPTIITP